MKQKENHWNKDGILKLDVQVCEGSSVLVYESLGKSYDVESVAMATRAGKNQYSNLKNLSYKLFGNFRGYTSTRDESVECM